MRDLRRLPSLLALALLLGSALVLLPFPSALPNLAPLRFMIFGACAAVAALAWWTRGGRGGVIVGAAAVLLTGFCFALSASLAWKLWFLQRFHAQAMVSCRDIHSPYGDGPMPADEIRNEYSRRTEVARQQALAVAHVPTDVAELLYVDCDGAKTSAHIYEGFDPSWYIESDGRMW